MENIFFDDLIDCFNSFTLDEDILSDPLSSLSSLQCDVSNV